MNKERLLNAAKALRESPNPRWFDMARYTWGSIRLTTDAIRPACGTPACVFGHYAHRTDLQNFMRIGKNGMLEYTDPLNEGLVDYDARESLEHFDITVRQAELLFSARGCDGAENNLEAAAYIERFVKFDGDEVLMDEHAVEIAMKRMYKDKDKDKD